MLQPKIIELAKQGRGPVGSAAVEALVALNVPLGSRVHSHVLRHLPGAVVRGIHISSILSYLGNTLPRLDAEIDTSSRDNGELPLPPVLKRGGGCHTRHASLLGLTCIRFRGARRGAHAKDSVDYIVVECSSKHRCDLDVIEAVQQ